MNKKNLYSQLFSSVFQMTLIQNETQPTPGERLRKTFPPLQQHLEGLLPLRAYGRPPQVELL